MSDMVFCRGCGKAIHRSARACPNCGAAQGKGGTKSRISAAMLALFFGAFGIHKFYLGKSGQGILYLLFCWTFIPTLISLVEGVMYLFKSDEEFEKIYC